MANYYNINRTVEAQEIRTIDPNDGQLKTFLTSQEVVVGMLI